MLQVTVLQLEKTYGKSKEAKAFIQSIIGGALDFFEWMKVKKTVQSESFRVLFELI